MRLSARYLVAGLIHSFEGEPDMNKTIASLLTGALLSALCLAQSSADMQTGASASQDTSVSANKSGVQAGSNSSANVSQETAVSGKNGQAATAGQLQAGSTVQAELTKPVDARKNKKGDEVVARTTQDVKSNGQIVLPKGSKIVGHVTDVQAREKGQQESHVAIAFERAVSKNGTQMPLALTLQAIGSSQTSAAMDDSMAGSSMAGSTMADENMPRTATSTGSASRGALGGVTSTPGCVVNTAGSAAGGTLNGVQSAGAGVAGGLTSTSQGVVGLPGLTLSSAASNSTSAGSVISSNTSNVHLDSGTRMILHATGQ
jgi:hypothetical protein